VKVVTIVNTHRLRLAGAAVAVGLLAVSCGSSGSSGSGSSGGSGGNKDPYVIGAITPLSGSLAFIGNALKAGTSAYFTYVNAHGGVNGHQIKFVALDDGGDANTALSDAHQLAEQNSALAITDWVLTNEEAQVLPYAKRQHLSMVTQGCDSSLANATNQVVFCASMPEELEYQPEVDFAASNVVKTQHPKVAVLDMDSLAQRGLQDNIVKYAGSKGWQIVVKKLVSLEATDMTAEATQVQQSHADVAVVSLDATRAQLFVSALRTHGSNIPVVNYDGGAFAGTLKTLHDSNLYTLSGFGFPSDTSAGMTQYDAAMKATKADPEAPFAVNGYTEGAVVVAALKKCGDSCSSQQLVDAMSKLGTFGTQGLTVDQLKYTSDYYIGVQGGAFYSWDATTSAPKKVSAVLPLPSGEPK
jgi:branched-chain amino acid transport system substrate-binding protein